MRASLDREVNVAQLATELSSALGRAIALSARMPGQRDERGRDLPGVLVLLDAETGQPLPDGSVDSNAVQRVVSEHVYADPLETPTMGETLVAALESATTISQLKTALLDAYRPEAVKALKNREQQRATRDGLDK